MTGVGIDGCKGGWVAAEVRDAKILIRTAPSLAELFTVGSQLGSELLRREVCSKDTEALILIDMPIGLPDAGCRACDAAGRALLGKRSSTLFPVPVRDAVFSPDYSTACEVNLKRQGRKFSIQMWNIIPKVRELDAFVSSQNKVAQLFREGHPELAFRRLSGEVVPLSKHSEEGMKLRMRILSDALGRDVVHEVSTVVKENRRILTSNDVVDALALAVMASRFASEIRFLGDGGLDSTVRRMEIAS